MVVPAAGLYVTPGLVDIHVHVYPGTGGRALAGDLSVVPDAHTFRSGVTTVVDAGTSGWRTFPDFKERVIDRSKTRVLALLNIVGRGMAGRPYEQTPGRHGPGPDRRDRAAVPRDDRRHQDRPLRRARSGSRSIGRSRRRARAKLPVMVDFGTFRPERPYHATRLREAEARRHLHAHVRLDPAANPRAPVRRRGASCSRTSPRRADGGSSSTWATGSRASRGNRSSRPSGRAGCPTRSRRTSTPGARTPRSRT